MTVNINHLLNQCKNIDRYSQKGYLPKNFVHLHKEVFKFKNLIIKGTNYKKNGCMDHYLFENEDYWLKYFQKFSFVHRFYGKYYKNNNLYLVMEYIKGITLDRLTKRQIKKINIELIKDDIHEVLQVFKTEEITHKDLRPHNIILSNSFKKVKIIDFQFCTKIGEYLKPKDLQSKEHYKKAIKSVGGEWRKPKMVEYSFDTDEYTINKIISEITQKKDEK